MDVNEIRRVKSELRILHLQIARLKLPVMVWMLPLRLSKLETIAASVDLLPMRLSKPLMPVLLCPSSRSIQRIPYEPSGVFREQYADMQLGRPGLTH